MNSLSSSINNYTEDDSQQYTSNDSGLSCNSNGGTESDNKNIPLQDFQCDDLTKSLFLNSFNGNVLIQDDDLYSYKSKMEFGSIFPNKFRSFNLTKSDSLNFKNSCSFSSIIHDVENLKISEPFHHLQIPTSVICKDDNKTSPHATNQSFRIIDEVKLDVKHEPNEKIRAKRIIKKNNTHEYLSSSIKDYRGDKALNDIVTFIQGSTKLPKTVTAPKIKTSKMPLIKVSECPQTKSDLVTPDSEVFGDTISKELKQISHSNIDADSGTQSSQFVSLNNSDEDSSQLFQEDFQQVLSKKQKKTSSQKSINPPLSPCQSKAVYNLKTNTSKKMSSNKSKKSGKGKAKNCSNSTLLSKESFQNFLSDQYISFLKKFNTAS